MPASTDLAGLTNFDPLRQQLLDAARAFAPDAGGMSALLSGLVDDVQRALHEPLGLFPVCHHSPSAAVHMIQRLRTKPPRVIFLEMCEDMRPLLEKLRDCKLPVALQAFAGQTDAFPPAWSPLSVVAPLTEFSAEYQAIVYCLENPTTELVFVDRSVDHIFQWMPQEAEELEKHLSKDEPVEGGTSETEEGEAKELPSHGAAVGVQLGNLEPTFDRFLDFLLKNAQVRYFAEWWEQYVEQAIVGADHGTYRQVMCLVGSLLRRLGRRPEDTVNDRLRERFMWTRMKEYLADHRIDPRDTLHICGAAHTASDVEEFGVANDKRWDIPPRTKTPWLYGLIPSSYAAIDHQFHFPPGTVTLSDASWQKAQRGLGLKPFELTKAGKTPAAPKKASRERQRPEDKTPVADAPGEPGDGLPIRPTSAPSSPAVARLLDYLTKPPQLASQDEEQLLLWSTGIVALARKNGYLSTTADSIAVYHTALLLAQLRNRTHPTPYDFRDAAITCLEKDRVPGKRSIRHICEILLGGDRSGQVGYTSLPPLAQDVYTRLAPLGLNLTATSIQRALMDFRQKPEWLACSDLLWKLRYLLQEQQLFRPIMGERKLGHVPTQESWDISLGKNQTPLIMLGYEGVTIEQVLERKLKTRAFATDAKTLDALGAAEDCLLYLKSVRLTEEIGDHAVGLLVEETGAQSAPEIFERVRRLVHYYRSTPTGLPDWIKRFVTTGYSHYATLLPTAFSDRGTTPDQIAGMLAFIFTLESLALSLGSSRSQLLIAVQQTAPVTSDPNKIGMLWAAEVLLSLRTLDSIRAFFDHLLENRLALPSFPAYVNGFLLALKFTPLVARLVVELVSRAFEKLPDTVLMPWLPGLIMTLRPHADTLLPTLLKEAATCYPDKLAALAGWTPPWAAAPPAAAPAAAEAGPVAVLNESEKAVQGLLFAEPATTNALAALLGLPPDWRQAAATPGPAAPAAASGAEAAVQALLQAEPAAMTALLELWRK